MAVSNGPKLAAKPGAWSDLQQRTWALAAFAAHEMNGDNRGPKPFSGVTHDRAVLERATAEARSALEEAARAAATAAAQALSVAAALDAAVSAVIEATPGLYPAPPGEASANLSVALSRRESEVLALVADGRTNKAIAEELFVSPNTVKTHVSSLFTKLHAGNRAELAAMAARHGEL